jgi:hypothetical protein
VRPFVWNVQTAMDRQRDLMALRAQVPAIASVSETPLAGKLRRHEPGVRRGLRARLWEEGRVRIVRIRGLPPSERRSRKVRGPREDARDEHLRAPLAEG